MTDYVLVSQDAPLVVHFARQSATQWTVREHTHPEDALVFAALGVTLTLADIYRKVALPASGLPPASLPDPV